MSVRTLRYYDNVGLLSPSARTDTGYRLYTEQDLHHLQHILALKFLGFSLEEIKRYRSSAAAAAPKRLGQMLAQQRTMMWEKRRQLDAILQAIESVQRLVLAGRCDGEAILRVIQVIQMEQKQEWVKRYLSDDHLQKMEALSRAAYSEEARQKLAQRGEWTEADQERATKQWAYLASESERLAAGGADPAGEEAQALARLKSELLLSFTQGDPEIEAGLARFWDSHNALPESEQPLASVVPSAVIPGARGAGAQLLDQAMTIYQERQSASEREP